MSRDSMSRPKRTKPPLGTGPIVVHCIRRLEDFSALEPGQRIATNNNMLLLSETLGGRIQWYEDGQLENYQPTSEWLPAVVLPPQVKL